MGDININLENRNGVIAVAIAVTVMVVKQDNATSVGRHVRKGSTYSKTLVCGQRYM
jgi:uncharacterized protein (DUF927 family)